MENLPFSLPADVGPTLARLREVTKLRQSHLARVLGVDSSRISRIEKGILGPSTKEVLKYLQELKTDDALRYLHFLEARWSVLKRPPSLHPNRDALLQTELQLQRLKEFQRREDVPAPLAAQAQMHENSLLRTAEYLTSVEHSVVMVGEIGVGKTTATCFLTGLLLLDEEQPKQQRVVLTTGKGRMTLCEVRLMCGPGFGIAIEPYSESEIYKLVHDICSGLMDAVTSSGKSGEKEVHKGVSEEIERALRNMAGLTKNRVKQPDGKLVLIDPALELAQEFANEKDLRAEFASRLRLFERNRRELWCDDKTEADGLRWLKWAFQQINHGLHPEFTLPRRIDVILPREHLLSSPLKIEVIDTKGIDQTANREDLRQWLENPRSLAVLCTSFSNAPATNIQQLIENLVSTGLERVVQERVILLILAREGDASGMIHDSGDPVADVQEGYELKREQVEGALARIGAADVPVLFFDALNDDPGNLSEELLKRLDSMRRAHVERISTIRTAIDKLIEDREKQWAISANRSVVQSLSAFLEKYRELPQRKRPVYQGLLDNLRLTHQRTLWASTRRNGSWWNFDVYYHLGTSASAEIKLRTRHIFDQLIGIVENHLDNEDLQPAHAFLEELRSNVDFWRENFFEAVGRTGKETFRPLLEDNWELWKACEATYGTGQPFREEIIKRLRDWFEDEAREVSLELLEKRIRESWQSQFLDPMQKLFPGQDAEC